MCSILKESQIKRRRGIGGILKNKIFLIILALAVVGGASYFIFFNKEVKGSTTATVKEWSVKRGDIKVGVETSGKVVAEDGVELSFSVSGDTLEVSEVFVKEGDSVKKGDKIATVKTESLEFELRNSYNSYQTALDNLAKAQSGATASEKESASDTIKQAEISLKQAQLSLDKIKQSTASSISSAEDVLKTAKENYEDNDSVDNSEVVGDAYNDLLDDLESFKLTVVNALESSDNILGIDRTYINDDFEDSLSLKNTSKLEIAKASYYQAKNQQDFLLEEIKTLDSDINRSAIDVVANDAVDLLKKLRDHLNDVSEMLDATEPVEGLSSSNLNSFKSSINSSISNINSRLISLKANIDNVQDEKDNLDDYYNDYQDAIEDLEKTKSDAEKDVATAQVSLEAKELSLKKAKADYNELFEPVLEDDLISARSSLRSAAIKLDQTRYNIAQATLTAPIDGKVVQLNYKVGDIILQSEAKPIVTIINEDTLFIEVNIEEADISKVEVRQKAYVIFEALNDLELEGVISFISMTSQTSNNGIVTYQVRVILENPSGSKIREGMSAAVEFLTGEARNVLYVPVQSVKNVEGSPSIKDISGEWIKVKTGFTDGKYVEIKEGLEEGVKIYY